MNLTFYGGAGSVTGANYLLESGDTRILIDCGVQQGGHFAEKQNFEPFGYDPKTVSAVFVTHAHLDHTGRIPKLYGEGFRGAVHSTPPTRDLAELILLDSEHILGKEAEREGKPNFCSMENITGAMDMWKPIKYHEPLTVGPFTVELYDAGHVLGSSIIVVKAEGKTVVFSGDLGNYPAPIIKPTELVKQADYCLIESTYGDRLHENVDGRQGMLEDAIEDTVRVGGTLIIPAFALERTQELLLHMHELFEQGRVPKVPVFVDSPLAIKMTAVYKKYESYFNTKTNRLIKSGDDILNFPELRLTLTTEQSKQINSVMGSKVIIAGSGMSQGGRILHHESRYLPDPKSTILFVGYQSAGSLGRRILDGAQMVKIFGEDTPVRCQRKRISGYSAHADQAKLLEWLEPMRLSVRKVFVVQGEPEAAEVFATKVRDELAVAAHVPKALESVVL